jgi:ribosome-associated protein
LLNEGDGALSDLIQTYPTVDRQQLRSLVRAAKKDAERGRSDAPRRLFRYLRELLDAARAD